jgi:hypothetical protein
MAGKNGYGWKKWTQNGYGWKKWAWQGLKLPIQQHVKNLFSDSLISIVGNGTSTLFWTDRWLNGATIRKLAPEVLAKNIQMVNRMSSPTSRPPGDNHTPNPALPLSPSPVSIPGPATTHISLACPAPGGFPRPIPAVPGGRSKLQRWSDTSSSSEGSCREVPHRDVGAAPSPTPVSYRAAVLSGRGCAVVPRSSVRPCVGALPSATQVRQGEEGWQVVVHRRSRKVQRLPRGGVHVDLRGKCYNCLSTFHRAARCRGPCRCFRCLRLGHRAARCPSRPAGGARPSVWQRLHVVGGVSEREVPRPPARRR